MSKMNTQDSWTELFEKYDITNRVKKDGQFEITAKQIKEFREPRLMAKFDSSESLPSILRKNKINILPNSRSSYILSDFKLYQNIPELTEHVTKMQRIEIPEYESIDIKNITTESNAINLLSLSNAMDDFLGEEGNVSTFNGRMGTGKFSFNVDRFRGTPINISVKGAQCEIDAGFENSNSVVIMEAKNVVHPDFHIRQLYYPYILWKTRVKKPIRLVFSIYSNQIYRLLEYEFIDILNYSSINLVQEKSYSLQETEINNEELFKVYSKTKIKYNDNQTDNEIPFIQADSFERVISLLEILYEDNKTEEEIADIMQFELRQSNYYFNAGRYLDLFSKVVGFDEDSNRVKFVQLTKLGKQVYLLNYKQRQLKLVELILEHKIFNELFKLTYDSGQYPEREFVKNRMREYNVCNEGQIDRRSSSVLSWIRWIFNLTNVK